MACQHSSVVEDAGLFVNRRGKTGRYRTVNKLSVIEESLFGKNLKAPEKVEVEDILIPCPEMQLKKCQKETAKRKIQVVNETGARTLYQSHKDIHQFPLILPFTEYKRIQKRSEEGETALIKQLNELQQLKKEEEEACERRKSEIRLYDLKRITCQPLTDLEAGQKEKAEHLLKEANEKRLDSVDDIKELNSRISHAKINAIRDAQVAEKEQLKKEMKEENDRLDRMMEIERLNQIAIQDEIRKKKQEEERKAACQIFSQIVEKEQMKILEIEKKGRENAEFRAKWANEMEKELKKKIDKRERDRKHLAEVFSENSELMNRKKNIKEHERLLDMKMLEEQRIKAEREEAQEREQLRLKMDREVELAKLRALQKKYADAQEAKDLLQAKRAIEAANRKWRLEQEQIASEKQKYKDEVKQLWAAQRDQAHVRMAIQTARDRRDFIMLMDTLKRNLFQEKMNKELSQKEKKKYKETLLRQINEKERQRIAEKNAHYEEGIRLIENDRLRRLCVEDAKRRRLKQLYNCGLPSKYIDDVLRRFPDLQTNE